MPKLQCIKCNFEFNKEEVPIRCPYCASEDSVVLYKTAQEYLDEIEH